MGKEEDWELINLLLESDITQVCYSMGMHRTCSGADADSHRRMP